MRLSRETVGFGNIVNGHFWRMQEHQGRLDLGIWDWSVELRQLPRLAALLLPQFGFGLFVSEDGEHWEQVSKDGFGNGFNYDVRTMTSTPYGLIVGMADPYCGTEIWLGTIF